jgi:hypothetical protein
MKANTTILLVLSVFLPLSLLAQTPTEASVPVPVFRDPFTLKLRVDKDHYYEERFEKAPYVADNDIYFFAGDHFGINVTMKGDQISGVSYQPNVAKADVEFKFTQDKAPDGRAMMMLVITSKLKRQLFVDALMTVPGKKEIYKTSVLPVQPGLAGFESWPHPIVQLVLRNLRFKGRKN